MTSGGVEDGLLLERRTLAAAEFSYTWEVSGYDLNVFPLLFRKTGISTHLQVKEVGGKVTSGTHRFLHSNATLFTSRRSRPLK